MLIIAPKISITRTKGMLQIIAQTAAADRKPRSISLAPSTYSLKVFLYPSIEPNHPPKTFSWSLSSISLFFASIFSFSFITSP